MQSNIDEEEKEAQVEQVEEEETNGLARRDFFDRNIRDAQLSVDEIEVDVSDDGGDLEDNCGGDLDDDTYNESPNIPLSPR